MNTALLPRSDYSTLQDSTYLNQASLGLIGQPAVSAMQHFIESTARHGNRYMSDSDEVAFFSTLRERAANLFDADMEQVAIVSSASEILGQLALMLQPPAGTKIVLISSDFPAVTRPWLHLVQQGQHALHFVDDDPAVDLTDALVAAIDKQTSVVSVSHVQFGTGTVVDIPLLRHATNAVGAYLIVDVTQSAGAMVMASRCWDADALVSSGYKWLGGHGGVALAVLSPRLLEHTPPLPGWMGAPEPFNFDATQLLMADDAQRYTLSTMSYASMAGLTIALDQLLAVGIDEIEKHASELAARLIHSVASMGWQPFHHLAEPVASQHIVSLVHSELKSAFAVDALRERNIICSSRGGRIRVSLAPYNDEHDVARLIDVLAEIG